MTNDKPRGRPELAFLGFLLTTALLLSVYLAQVHGWFDSGGLFFPLALGNVVAGLVIRFGFADRPWRAFGTGLLVGGVTGLVLMAAFLFLLYKALSSIPI